MQLGAAAAGISLLLEAGWRLIAAAVLAQDEGDEDDSNNGRGRGRHGRDDDEQDDEVVPLAEIPAGAFEIRIVSDDAGGFIPAELTVELGQTIAFVNGHDDEHTATGSGFDTGIMQPGAVTIVDLGTAGRFAYACQIHPEMTGTIVVRDADGNVPEPVAVTAPTEAVPVSIVNLAFDPSQVSVQAGAAVVWTNGDSVPHTVTSADGAFDSGIFDPGATFTWTFDQPGAFAYACQLHPQMVGDVTVAEGATLSTTNSGGELTEAESQAGQMLAGVWLLELRPANTQLISDQYAIVTFREEGAIDADFASNVPTAEELVRLSAGHGEWAQRGEVLGFSVIAFTHDEHDRFSGLVTMDAEASLDTSGSGMAGEFTFSITTVGGGLLGEGAGAVSGRKIPLEP